MNTARNKPKPVLFCPALPDLTRNTIETSP